jgi:tetratricopeptide (TPR) repeat protein
MAATYRILITLLWTGSVIPSCSQESRTFVQLVAEAEKATSAKDWESAAVMWEKVNEQNPLHEHFTYQLGNAYEQTGQYDKALALYEKGFQLSGKKSYYDAFNIAKVYAKKGDKKNAIIWLKKSFDLGMPNRSTFRHQAFDLLKSDPDFQYLSGTQDVASLSRTEGWRFDLKFLHDEISRKAFHVVRDFSRDDLERESKKIYDAIPRLTDMQITIEFMKLMTAVGDGHTMLFAMGDNAEIRKNIPVEFYRFKEGLYIVQADKRFENLLGAKVIAIENKSPEEVVSALDPILSRDNPQTLKVMSVMRMRQTSLLHALGIYPSPDKLTIHVADRNGKSGSVTLDADSEIPSRRLWDGLPGNWVSLENTLTQRPLYLRNRYDYYWFDYLPEEKTVWFQYNRVLDSDSNPYATFLDSMFAFIDGNDVERFVIDMRNNNGGNGELSYPLVHGIVRQEKINQWGKLFVITGRKTFSAAGICISLLEKHTKAIFAGEPAGTSPNFIGEEFEFELPYSHLAGNVSDRAHHYANAVDHRSWISPSIYAEPTYEDFIKGRDAVWEAIRVSYPTGTKKAPRSSQ